MLRPAAGGSYLSRPHLSLSLCYSVYSCLHLSISLLLSPVFILISPLRCFVSVSLHLSLSLRLSMCPTFLSPVRPPLLRVLFSVFHHTLSGSLASCLWYNYVTFLSSLLTHLLPQQCSALIVNRRNILQACNACNEDYLFHEHEQKVRWLRERDRDKREGARDREERWRVEERGCERRARERERTGHFYTRRESDGERERVRSGLLFSSPIQSGFRFGRAHPELRPPRRRVQVVGLVEGLWGLGTCFFSLPLRLLPPPSLSLPALTSLTPPLPP